VSYCDFTYLGDAVDAYKWYTDGYLPEVWDESLQRPCSIMDQTDFFIKASRMVEGVKNKAESERMKESKNKADRQNKGR